LMIQMIRVLETNSILRIKDGRILSVSSGMLDDKESLDVAISRFEKLTQEIKGGVLGFDSAPSIQVIKRAYNQLEIECIVKPKSKRDEEEILDFVEDKGISLYEFERRHYR